MRDSNQAKWLDTLVAAVALHCGIAVTPSRTDRGERTVILVRGAWVREVSIEELCTALEEAKAIAMPGVASAPSR